MLEDTKITVTSATVTKVKGKGKLEKDKEYKGIDKNADCRCDYEKISIKNNIHHRIQACALHKNVIMGLKL